MPIFHLFPQLPTELRLAIWRLCLPHRVLELDYQFDSILFGRPGPCAKNKEVTDANNRIPALSRVNHEARGVALESWQPLPVPPPNSPDGASMWSLEIPEPMIVSHRTQFVHLNWAPEHDAEDIWEAVGDPLLYAVWVADQMPESEISVHASLLEDVQFGPYNERHPWTREELGDLLRRRKSCTVMVQEPVFVHGDFHRVAQAGLFGLLGDAPVQIVHLDEEARLNSFVELGREEGIKFSANPFENRRKDGVQEPEGVKLRFKPFEDWLKDRLQELSDTITAVFGPDERDAPHFVPAVMFRYCPHNCASN
jgi:hypothetical protein